MINVYPYESLGHAYFGWLDARHHFSFGRYMNRARMGFGTIRVINDDQVKAGSGFDMHPHNDMEIITFVRSGAITHRDSRGNEGRTEAGDVQVMSAGSGIYHSEFNLESEDTTLYQIWITPKELGITPRWEAGSFKKQATGDTLPLLVSGRAEDEGKGALYIHQDATIHGGRLSEGQTVTQAIRHQAYLLVSSGQVKVMGRLLSAGDGAEITESASMQIEAVTDSEVIVIDAPAEITLN